MARAKPSDAPTSRDPIDREIFELHRRFLAAMESRERLHALSKETKIHYLTILKSLTTKLEVPGKPLAEVVREVMADAAPLLFQAMQS